MELRVYHRLYTHVPKKPGTTGGNIHEGLGDLDIKAHHPKHVVETVEKILESLVPSGTDPAFAVRRFAAQGHSFACLIVSYPDLVKDGYGRPGSFTHARLVRVPSDHAWLDIHALLECAATISLARVHEHRDSQARLAAYVDQLEERTEAAAWHPTILQNIEFSLLWEVTSVLMSYATPTNATARAPLVYERSDDAMLVLASAWSTLPIALQISCTWALGSREGVPAAILFGRPGGSRYEVTPQARTLANDLLVLLRETSFDYDSLFRNEKINTLDLLQAEVSDLQGAEMIGSAPLQDEVESAPISDKNAEPPQVQQPSIAAAEALRHQLTVFDDRMRKYIDERLKTHQAARQYAPAPPLPDGTPAPPGAPPPAAFAPSQRVFWAGIAGAVIAAGMVFFLSAAGYVLLARKLATTEGQLRAMEARLPPPPAQRGTRPGLTTTTGQSERFDLSTIPHATWRDRLRWVMENRHDLLAPTSAEMQNNSAVDGDVRGDIRLLQERAVHGTLNQKDRLKFRALLFEYITVRDLSRWARIKIDGDLKDVPQEALDELRNKLKVETAATAGTMDDFMAEAVLRRVVQ
jgi:hypothetical protein